MSSILSHISLGVICQNPELITTLQALPLTVHHLADNSADDDLFELDIVLVEDEKAQNRIINTQTPHILLADMNQANIAEMLEQGYVDYIPKPLNIALVEHRIKQVVQSKPVITNNLKDDPEEIYQTILSNMSEPIFVFDRDGKYIHIPINQTENYIQPPETMRGKQLHDHFPEKTADKFLKAIQQALDTQSRQIIDYELYLENRRGFFSAHINPIPGRDAVIWVARDVTRNKLNELAIIETEQRYRQLFDHANDIILIVELKTGRILSANKQAQKQLGYTNEELLSLNINDIEVTEKDTQSQVVTRTLTTSGYIVVEQTYRKKDNTLLPVETSSRLTTDRHRKVLLNFSRNIKQRKAAMEAKADERYFAEALRDIVSQLAGVHTLDEVLDVMLTTVTKVVDSESSNIMFIEDDTAYVVRQHGRYHADSQPKTIHIPSTFTLRQMRQTQQAMIIANVENDPRWVQYGDTPWSKSYVGAPIKHNDEVIGYINLDSSQPQKFTNKHRQRLQAFTDQATIAIQNAQLYEANLRYTADLEEIVKERTQELTDANQELLTEITKRLDAEESLSEERNLLRTIINSLPDTVYVKNQKSEYVLANRFPHINESEQPIIGKTDLDIVRNKDLAEKQHKEEQDVLENGAVFISEDYIINTEGDERWIIRTKLPFHDDNDNIVGIVGVNQDITKIKMAERQLRQLLSNAHCLLWYANVEFNGTNYDWTITVENEETAHQFLPFDTNNETYTQAWLNSIPEQDQALRETVATTHLRYNQKNYKVDYQCITDDQSTHWLSEDVQIQQITENRWHLIGVSLDITTRKSAEIALSNANAVMEKRVVERTAELQQTNQELEKEIKIRQQAETAERKQRQFAETLKDTITAMNSTLQIEDVLDRLLDGIDNIIDHDASNIMLFNDGMFNTVRQRGYDYTIPDLQFDTFTDIKIVYQTKAPYIIYDTLTDENWKFWEPASWIRSSIKLPIIQNNEVIGIIILDSSRPHTFTSEYAETLLTFANQASIALNNANLYRQAQAEISERKRAEVAEREQRQFAETLREAATSLNRELNTGNLFDTILEAIEKFISVHDTSSIILFTEDSMMGKVVKARGFEKFGDTVEDVEFSFDTSINKRQLLDEYQPLLITDTKTSDLWIDFEETAWIRSHIGIPIHIQDTVLALISLDSIKPNTFTQEHVERLVIFSHQVAIAIKNAQLVEEIKNYAQHLETRVEQRTRELELERSQLRAILDAMRDGVYYSDKDHKPVYINNALSEITGYTAEVWLSGKAFAYVNNAVSLDRKQMWADVEAYLDENQFWQTETILTRSDKRLMDASLTRTKVTGADNQLEGIVTVVRDISLQKQLEQQKARFIANAAHELRTPITNIKTRLFLMKHAPEKFTEHLAIAESAINWMQSLVENLFEHSRFERGIIQLDIERIVLQSDLYMIVETHQAEAQYKNINIVAEWQPDDIIMYVDRSRFRQVIANLLNNALNYTPEGGMITVSAQEIKEDDKQKILLQVADTGVGIEKSHLANLFQPFYRAIEDGKGAGLGLSIAREIIEAHQGTIEVDSTIGEGTTFSITLPKHQTEEK